MGYFLNDFTAAIIGLFVAYTTFEVVNRFHPLSATRGAPIVLDSNSSTTSNPLLIAQFVGAYPEISLLCLLLPFAVWYSYQFFLNVGPKGTSKAIKI